ncbi:hypothetical protein GCM10017771_76520 [Streptomyces capitiformicae]|uniref:Uncharacterized protein n=1 Tax=Streptomyces capitiformicae TaxID=2014920 RepID=A0A919DKG7_9ACTN|nr:hypothetical protein GCM10017771_76520 [Streptomyces capitiformicae]
MHTAVRPRRPHAGSAQPHQCQAGADRRAGRHRRPGRTLNPEDVPDRPTFIIRFGTKDMHRPPPTVADTAPATVRHKPTQDQRSMHGRLRLPAQLDRNRPYEPEGAIPHTTASQRSS